MVVATASARMAMVETRELCVTMERPARCNSARSSCSARTCSIGRINMAREAGSWMPSLLTLCACGSVCECVPPTNVTVI